MILKDAPLGKRTDYPSSYDKELLFSLPRKGERTPFCGVDIWTAFEISWLNLKGKPQVAIGEFFIPCSSPNLIESKSFKLYLNSFNNSRFASIKEILIKDLSQAAGADVTVYLLPLTEVTLKNLEGKCLDDLDIEVGTYNVDPTLLRLGEGQVEETVTTNLFKSNCLITAQPDFASISISYQGQKIREEALLCYLISYRNHQGFHEECTEQIFLDLKERCDPKTLTVNARFTRRGGLDINCIRSTGNFSAQNLRTPRQ